MSAKYVHPGHTHVLSGTLARGNFEIADGGRARGSTSGGVILVSTTAINDGFLGAEEGYSNPSAEGRIVVTGVLTNNGTVNLARGFKGFGLPAGGGYMSNSGTFTNTGHVILYGGGFYDYPGEFGSGATLNNTGVLTNSGSIYVGGGAGATNGGGVLLDVGQLSNTGTIVVYEGLGNFGGKSSNGGTILVSGTLNNAGQILLHGGVDADGAGGQLEIGGVAFNTGLIVAESGNGEYPDEPDTGATIVVAGVLHNIGQIDINGGEVDQGRTGTPGALIDSGLLRNSGTILLTQQGSFSNVAGAVTVTSTGVLSDSGTIAGNGTLLNEGIINSGLNGSTTGLISATYFFNEGVVDVVPNSALMLNDIAVSDGESGHYGVFDLLANSTLTLGGFVSSQTVSFIGSQATLVMANLPGFEGRLDVEKSNSTIDFLGQDIIAAKANSSYLALTLANGTSRYLYTTGISAGTTLSLLSDGRGGTDLVFTNVGAAQQSTPSAAPYPASAGVLSTGWSRTEASDLQAHFVTP